MPRAARRRRAPRAAAKKDTAAKRPRTFWLGLGLCALLLALEAIVYAPTAGHEFTDFDDPAYVRANPHVAAGLTWRGVGWAFTTAHAANWHPLTWLSHMLDVQLFGMQPGAHHLSSLVLHMANTVLLLVVLTRLTGQLGRSALVAGLFGLHPLHVESVAWVAERKDLLSTLLGFSTLWATAAYVRRPGRARYALVAIVFALGLSAKPMLVTLPFVLVLLDVWPLGRVGVGGGGPGAWVDRRALRASLVEKLPLFALALASSVVTFVVQRHAGAVGELQRFPFGARLANAVVSYVAYLEKAFWPAGLAVFYPYDRALSAWRVAACALILLAVTGAAFALARRAPAVAVGWCWYLGTLVPVIGLVQVGNQSMADRYTYVPLIGVSIMLAWGLPALLPPWPRRSLALGIVASGAVLASAAVAREQVTHWKDRETLWTRALAVTADNWTAHDHLGLVRAAQGRLDEAAAHFEATVRIRPDFEGGHVNLGNLRAGQGRLDDAVRHYREALRLKPSLELAHNNLGVALLRLGRTDEAIAEFTEALRIRPDLVDAHRNLGIALAARGRLAEAGERFRDVLELAPADADAHYRLGLVLAAQGDLASATRHLETAVRLLPNSQQARRALAEVTSRREAGAPPPR
jgi:protein O-mannosyl-transferase